MLLVVRLLRRDTIQYTLSGFVGVIIAAVVARTTGRAEDYFLPGLLLNVGLAFTYLVSILVRWPAIGVIVGPITGEGMSWRQDPPRRAAYTRATWVFFAGQCLRAAIQTPLWLAGALGALAASKLVLGWPLLLLQVWIAYRLLRHVPLSVPATAEPRARNRRASVLTLMMRVVVRRQHVLELALHVLGSHEQQLVA